MGPLVKGFEQPVFFRCSFQAALSHRRKERERESSSSLHMTHVKVKEILQT